MDDDPNEIADFYLNLGVKTVILKVGDEGAFIKTLEEAYTVPGCKVEKVVVLEECIDIKSQEYPEIISLGTP